MAIITGSVGRGGKNKADDVRIVQRLVNIFVNQLGVPELDDDGDAGTKTKRAIETFQRKVVGFRRPDGRVDPDGKTLGALIAGGGDAVAAAIGTKGKAVPKPPKKAAPKKEKPKVLTGTADAPWLAYALAEKTRWEKHLEGYADEVAAAKKKAKKTKKRWSNIFRQEEYTDRDWEYFSASPYTGGSVRTVVPNDNRHWCAAFVNWCLHRAGYSHTGLATAISFTKKSWWKFKALDKPKKGCVVVCSRTGGYHVAFLWEKPSKGSVKLLGGNQGQRITISGFKTSTLEQAKDDKGRKSAYFWPERRGTANCNHLAETEHPHFVAKIALYSKAQLEELTGG